MNASSSLAQLRAATEVTYGDVAGATGRRRVRMTGETLSHKLQFEKSKEIRGDRQNPDSILVGVSAAGGFGFEGTYNEYDYFFESALQSTFLAFGTAGVSPTLTTPTFAASTLTQTGGTSFATLVKGQWFQIRGCTGAHAANNGLWQVSLTVNPTATVITVEGTFTQTGAASGTVTISTSRLVNGITLRSHLLELQYADVTQFKTMRGLGLNKLSMGLQSKAVVTGAFEFVGKDSLPMNGTSQIPSTDSPNFPTAYRVLNATSNVARIYEAGAAVGAKVKSLSFDLDNALRLQDAIANLGPVELGNGDITLTGKMTAYFKDAVLFNKAINNNDTSLMFAIADAAEATGNGYVVSFPAIEYTNVDVKAGQQSQDMMVELDWEAKIDTISGKMMCIDRFGAAAV